MSGLAKTFQVARVEEIGGTNYKFARLEVEKDLADIAGLIIAERKTKARRIADEENSSPDKRMHIGRFELLSILQKIEDNEPSVSEIYARAGTPSGAPQVLRHSLLKAGYSLADANSIIAKVDAPSQVNLAQDLVMCSPAKEEKEDGSPPLASTPAGSAKATPAPGVPSEAELQARAVGYAQSAV